MVQEYTTEYIQCTYDSLKYHHSNLYFVKDTLELRDVFNKIITDVENKLNAKVRNG